MRAFYTLRNGRIGWKREIKREREQQQLYWQLFDRICSRIRRMHCIRHLCHLAFCFTIWATINTKHICSHIKPKRYRVRARFSLTVRCVCVCWLVVDFSETVERSFHPSHRVKRLFPIFGKHKTVRLMIFTFHPRNLSSSFQGDHCEFSFLVDCSFPFTLYALKQYDWLPSTFCQVLALLQATFTNSGRMERWTTYTWYVFVCVRASQNIWKMTQ